jgi:EmrB/QacA subfamily drug resistance transporter
MRLPQGAVKPGHKWIALAVLCLAFFMDILDVAIVNVALPTIQEDLNFTQQNLAWVVSAYALTYGGLLLLGGRIADRLGRRMIFMAGVSTFALSSLVAGLAWADSVLIAARAFQGVGAAMMTPAALSLVMNTFTEGGERNKALGIWGAVGASGGTMGVLLGGIFTDTIGWEWIFYLNVPVSALILIATPLFVAESRAQNTGKSFDIPGAATITGAIALLTYGLIDAESAGWSSPQTILLFVASAVLFVSFVVIERRSASPLVPFSIFRLRSLTGANVGGFALGASIFGMIFIVTLFMQQVLGYSPIKTGFAWLAMSLAALVSAIITSQAVTKVGVRGPMVGGLVLAAIGFGLLAGVPIDASYATDILPGLLIFGTGLGMAFVSASIGALEGVKERDSGLASGLINTMQQVGGALGVAILATIALSKSNDLIDSGEERAAALTSGFSAALYAGVGFALFGAIAAFVLIRGRKSGAPNGDSA